MKRWLVAIVAATLASASMGAEMVTQAKTIAQLLIPAGRDGKAMFQGLKADALQMGNGEVVLNGLVEYQTQADTTTRVSIRWHAIGLTNAAATQSLTSPLTSQFRTADKTVPPGTIINVRGDLDLLAEDYLKLKARMAKESPKDTVKQVNNNNTSTDTARNANELGSSGSSGSGNSSYGNSPYSTTNDNNKMNTDMVTTSWQDCQPRIDRTGGTVYQQARKLDTTASGRLMGTGSCEDHGATAPIARTYDATCLPVIDVDNRKVYHQFAESATLNDKKIDVSACTADFTKFDSIKSTTEGCGYRHDFTAGKSILQEKLYYNDLTGAVVSVRDCGDSATAFAQYTTRATCSATIDNINKAVFFNERVAFKDANGAEQYASDCKPDGKAATQISEEFCSPKYEHDFVNHVSYYRTRAYYLDTSGNKIYATTCGRSSADSFPHIFDGSGCTVRNDDSLLMTYWSKMTQINSPTDGMMTISPCQETSSPTPYAYSGRINGATTTIQNNTLYTYQSLVQRFPAEATNFSTGISTFAFAATTTRCCTDNNHIYSATYGANFRLSGGAGYMDQPTNATDPFGWAIISTDMQGSHVNSTPYIMLQSSVTLGNNGTPYDSIARRPYVKSYLRGDGTYYQYEDGAHYIISAGFH